MGGEMMQCQDCKRLRHHGPCDPVFDEPEEMELLAIDAQQAQARYLVALNNAAEGRQHEGVSHERGC